MAKLENAILENQTENEETNLSPADEIKCDHCGSVVTADEISSVEGHGKICQSCLDNDFSYCEILDGYDLSENFTKVFNKLRDGRFEESYVSNKALEDNYFQCDDCGEYHQIDNKIKAHNERGREIEICPNCEADNGYYTCADCGDTYHGDYTESVGDDTICRHCIDNGSYSYCECEERYYNTDHDSCDCEDDESSDLIKNYSFKPAPIFKGHSGRLNPFIGFELEIETPENKTETAEIVTNLDSNNRLYLKSDGSLDDGFEIVSHPATLSAHREENYGPIFKAISQNGGRSHDTKTCGLHFHLETAYMTENHKIRLGMFLTLCQSEFEILARRKESSYAKFKKADSLSEFKQWENEDRYAALNWQNKKTVEFRIFKGTLKYETFLASMQLCVAAYRFTLEKNSMAAPLENNAIFKRFLKHVLKLKSEYPELIEYLKSKNFSVTE